jgi:hypothetical protein
MMLMDRMQLGFVAHALGRQGFAPDEFWLSCFASHSAPKLASMKPRQLSNTLWAVARWQADLGVCVHVFECGWVLLFMCVLYGCL